MTQDEKYTEQFKKALNDYIKLGFNQDECTGFMHGFHKGAEAKQLILSGVGSSAWYCKISTINGQWFEIVTGKNEMDVCIKIEKRFGKETKYQLIDKYELM